VRHGMRRIVLGRRSGGGSDRIDMPGARRLVGVLALTETVSFGVLLYAFSVLLLPMERDLGASRGALSSALAAAALARAVAAPLVGGLIDRHGVRWLMTTGSIAGVGLVWAWSEVSGVSGLVVVFTGIGVVGSMVFYEPAFAAIARLLDGRAQARGTLTVTVAAGFASTIFFPTTALLEQGLGWRGALKVLALVLLVLTVLPNLLLLRDRRGRIEAPGPDVRTTDPAGRRPVGTVSLGLREALGSRDFRLLALLLIGGGLPVAMYAAHLPALLEERGESALLASSIAGMLGVLSVAGRILLTVLNRHATLPRLLMGVFLLQGCGTLVLLLGGPGRGAVVGFVLLFGIGYGTLSIATPLLVSQRFGRRSFGSIAGALEGMTGALAAAAPVAAGLLRDAAGDYRPVMLVTLAGSLFAVAACRRLESTHSDPSTLTARIPAPAPVPDGGGERERR
jgi:MFS family permease